MIAEKLASRDLSRLFILSFYIYTDHMLDFATSSEMTPC